MCAGPAAAGCRAGELPGHGGRANGAPERLEPVLAHHGLGHPHLDSEHNVGVLGHSLGGMLIPRIGKADPGLAGLGWLDSLLNASMILTGMGKDGAQEIARRNPIGNDQVDEHQREEETGGAEARLPSVPDAGRDQLATLR